MGAYENPVEVIDTSGQYWAQALTSVGNIVITAEERRRKRLALANKAQAELDQYTLDYTNKRRDKIYDIIARNNITNPTIIETADVLLAENVKYMNLINSATTQQQKSWATKQQGKIQGLLSQITPLHKRMKEGRGDYIENYSQIKAGDQGGVTYFGNPTEMNYKRAMLVDSGMGQGSANWSVDINNLDAGININYQGHEFKEKGGWNVSAITMASFIPTKIPNTTRQMVNILEPSSVKNPDGAGITNKNGDISDQFLDHYNTTSTPSKDGTSVITKTPPNYNEIALAVNTTLETKAMAQLTNYNQANSIWQNTLVDYSNGEDLPVGIGGSGIVTPEGTTKFVNAFKEYFGRLIPGAKYVDLSTEEGRELIEGPMGQYLINKLNLIETKPGSRDWIQDVNNNNIIDEGETTFKGDVPMAGLKGKISTKGASRPRKDDIVREETQTRLDNLILMFDELDPKRGFTQFSNKSPNIVFNSAFQLEMARFGFAISKPAENTTTGEEFVTLKSDTTNKAKELPSKGLSDLKLKQQMYILDGGKLTDTAYKNLKGTKQKKNPYNVLPVLNQ